MHMLPSVMAGLFIEFEVLAQMYREMFLTDPPFYKNFTRRNIRVV